MKRALVILALFASQALAGDYAGSDAVREFAQRMEEEHGFDAAKVAALLAKAEKQQSILEAISRPAEKTKSWYEYRAIFLDEQRIEGGVAFWQKYDKALKRAKKTFGVDPAIIVAILGVETRYGTITGSYRVLDALTTLGFDYPPRAEFFSEELEHFLLLAREQKQDPTQLKGSYAGAMGYGQFIPSSYRAYAVDFDGDDLADIWHNPVDAIGSIANYFKVHGWQPGQQVMVPAEIAEGHESALLNKIHRPRHTIKALRGLGYTAAVNGLPPSVKAIPLVFENQQGREFWLGFNNFYVITRYNHSPLYARAVWELSEAIQQRRQSGANQVAEAL